MFVRNCSQGYDVSAISCAERFVVGLDFSETCIKQAKKVFFPLRRKFQQWILN